MYYSTHYESPLGDILLASDEENIIGLWIGEQKYIGDTLPEDITEKKDIPILIEGVTWLNDYFTGRKPNFVQAVSCTNRWRVQARSVENSLRFPMAS